MNKPIALFYGGTNGSGKSTLRSVDDNHSITNHIDPDAIARRINPIAPRSVDMAAGREAVKEFRKAVSGKCSFSMETTLTGKGVLQRMQESKDAGFFVELRYVGLKNASLNIERVSERVTKGGHHIDSDVIVKRYDESLKNLTLAIGIADVVKVFDNSTTYRHELTLANGKVQAHEKSLTPWVNFVKEQFLKMNAQNLEPIHRIDFQDFQKNEIQDTVIRAVQANPDQFINRFIQHPISLGGRFISSDSFKETFEQYRESNESRNLYNNVVHNSAAVLASEQLRRVLQEPKEAGRDTVVLLTGIPGAGKTSSVLRNGKLSNGVHAVYEGQLSNQETAIAKVQQVLDAGFKPVIMAVHRRPEDALDSTLQRFTEIGRGASISVMANIQGGLHDSLNAVHERFGNQVKIEIFDKRDSENYKRLLGWEHLNILKSEGNHENVKHRLNQHLESRQASIEPAAYRQSAGLSPITGRDTDGRGYAQSNERNDSRPSITQENWHDVGLEAASGIY